MEMKITLFTFIAPILAGIISAYLAAKRGRNPYTWLFLGFLLGIYGIFAIIYFPSIRKRKPKPEDSPLKPVLTLQGPIDRLWYYLDPTRQQQGPMSRDAFTAAWKEGKLNLSTYVWHEGLSDWKPLKELVE